MCHMKFEPSVIYRLVLVCTLSIGCGSSSKPPGTGTGGASATGGSAGSTATGGAGGGAGASSGTGGTAGGVGGATGGAAGATAGIGGTNTGSGGTAGIGGTTSGSGGAAGAAGATAGMGGAAGSGGVSSGTGGGVGASGGSAGAGGALAACDVSAAFGTPVLVAGINDTGNNGEGRLSADELTIYFYSDRGGNNNVYTATRASRTDAFGTPQALTSVNTNSADGWPSISSTGLDLFLESNVSGKYAVYVATRSTLLAQFSAPALVANVNIAGTDNGQPNVLPDESAIYFVSYQTASSNWDVYRAARTTGGQFGTPAQVSTINTPSDEYAPTPTSDELVLYFGSARPDSPAKGNGMDVWIAKASFGHRRASIRRPTSRSSTPPRASGRTGSRPTAVVSISPAPPAPRLRPGASTSRPGPCNTSSAVVSAVRRGQQVATPSNHPIARPRLPSGAKSRSRQTVEESRSS